MGYVWWRDLRTICRGEGGEEDNVKRKLGDMSSTLFWEDRWMMGESNLKSKFRRLFIGLLNQRNGCLGGRILEVEVHLEEISFCVGEPITGEVDARP